MPYRFRGLGAQVADTRFGPVASSLAIAPSGSAAFRNPANAVGANSGQGVMVAIDPLPPITGPATLVTTNITQPAAVQPVSTPVQMQIAGASSDPWFLGYSGVALLALMTMKGGGKLLAIVPAFLAYTQFVNDGSSL